MKNLVLFVLLFPLMALGSSAGNLATGGGGGGGVSSVGLALPNIFSVAGSPVTTSGTLTGSLATESANACFAGPTSGGAATPTFRALVAADIPNLAASKITSGQLANTQGGTGQDSSAFTGIAHVSTGTWSASTVVNADVSATAAIARSKVATGTTNHVVINDGSTGALSSEAQLANTRGGTGQDSSAFTGLAHVSSGTWSASAVGLAGSDVTGNLGVSHLNSGTSASSSTFWRGDATWAAPATGVTTMAAIGSSPNANSATISGANLNLEPASASFGGIVTTGTQTIAGAKTFTGAQVNSGGLTMSSANIVAAAGTAAAPAIQTDSGGKTGIYSAGTGIIGISAPNSGTGSIVARFYGLDAGGGTAFLAMSGTVYPVSDNLWTSGLAASAWANTFTYNVQNSDNSTANGTVAPSLTVRGGNKTAGTGNGGALTLAAGTSSGGTAGAISLQTSGATSYQITGGNTLKNVLSANESTGAGSALLGANCPAGTVTAPYTWIKMISSDGSTVFVPAWK